MNLDKEGLESLLKRVKAATGPDQILDLAIADALLEYQERKQARIRLGYNFTASIDASLALVERLLGHAATVNLIVELGAAQHTCVITLFERDDEPFVAEGLRTPPLALLAALLSALNKDVR